MSLSLIRQREHRIECVTGSRTDEKGKGQSMELIAQVSMLMNGNWQIRPCGIPYRKFLNVFVKMFGKNRILQKINN